MRRHLDHLLGAIDAGNPSAGEPLAHQRYGHAMTAADLQHAIGWVERQGVHRPHEPFRGLTCHAYTQPFPNTRPRRPRRPAPRAEPSLTVRAAADRSARGADALESRALPTTTSR